MIPQKNKVQPEGGAPKKPVLEYSVSDRLGSFRAGTWRPHVSAMADVSKFMGADTATERLKTTWTTFGVVSALLLTISFPIVVMPTDDMLVEAEDIDPAVQDTYIILMGTGLVMSLTVVILVTVLISQIDLTLCKEHTQEFIQTFSWAHETITGIFSVSVIVLFVAVLVKVWIVYNNKVIISLMVIFLFHMVLVAILAAMFGIFNRWKIGEYGNKIMTQRQKEWLEELAKHEQENSEENNNQASPSAVVHL